MPYRISINSYLSRHGFTSFRPKAALIDMDGTLYDSMPNHSRAWHRLMTEMGVNCSQEEFLMYEGMTGEATIRLLLKRELDRDITAEEAREIYKRKTEYFSMLPEVHTMPGAVGMLDTFKKYGVERVLVTGSGQRSVIDRIHRDFPGMFGEGCQVTSRDVVHGKPAPEPFLKGMEIAGASPWESIVVENAPLGVKAGAASGAFTVGVTTGPLPEGALQDAGADLVFPSMPDFARALPLLLYQLVTTKLI